jgi:hypothetical protein
MANINVRAGGELIHSSQKELQVVFGDGSSISYNSLDNLPNLFDGNYSSLNGLPSLFDGNYASLTNKPVLNKLSTYTVATAPAGTTGDMIMVSDSTPANAPAYFDGTDWKYMSDNAVI